MHIRAYTCIFILKHTAKSLSGGVLEGKLLMFSGRSVKSRPPDLLQWVMRLDRNARIWHGGLPSRAGGGAQNRVCKSVAYDGKKCMPRCPGVP